MILEMRKLAILTLESEVNIILSEFKSLGLFHLINKGRVDNDSLFIRAQLNRFAESCKLLEQLSGRFIVDKKFNFHRKDISRVLEEMLERRSGHLDKIRALKKDIKFWEYWGECSRNKYETLESAGICFYFYKAKQQLWQKQFYGGFSVFETYRNNGFSYLLLIGQGIPPDLPFEVYELPMLFADEARSAFQIESDALHILEAELASLSKETEYLKSTSNELNTQLILKEANQAIVRLDLKEFVLLNAWFPALEEAKVKSLLDSLQLAYSIEIPEKGDEVPVVLQNKKYLQLFEPITRIFQLPSYFEFDLTPFIAVFYPILFAYCLGDAGYGFLLTLIPIFGIKSFLKNQANTAWLIFVLGVMTFITGLIKSGSVFGIALSNNSPFDWARNLQNIVLIPDDTSVAINAFNVALVIGIVQIITAVIIAIAKRIRYFSLRFAIPEIGKFLIICSVIALFLLRKTEIFWLMNMALQFGLVGGILMVLFFHDLAQKPLQRIATGVLPIFFIFTGLLGDILSYVRLFALGVASSVLGLVVNQIGGQIWEKGGWYVVAAVVFFLLGHGLNFGLAVLGSFVHPLRLTFVEFYNNAGFEGNGLDYKPFGK